MKKLFTILAVLTFGLATITEATNAVYFAGTNTQQRVTKSVKPSKTTHKKS